MNTEPALHPRTGGPPKAAPRLARTEEIRRSLDEFSRSISNPNTRRTYMRPVNALVSSFESRGLTVADWTRENLEEYLNNHPGKPGSKAVILAAIRAYLEISGILPDDPLEGIPCPRPSRRRIGPPAQELGAIQTLFVSIPLDTVGGLRDRILIELLFLGSSIESIVGLNIENIRFDADQVRLHGLSLSPSLSRIVAGYLNAANLAGQSGPLLRTLAGKTGALRPHRLGRSDIARAIRRRTQAVGLSSVISIRSLRRAANLANP